MEEFPAAITVCDSAGIILEMNAKAAEDFKDDGGRQLIGKNLLDCHPESDPRETQTAYGNATSQRLHYTERESAKVSMPNALV